MVLKIESVKLLPSVMFTCIIPDFIVAASVLTFPKCHSIWFSTPFQKDKF